MSEYKHSEVLVSNAQVPISEESRIPNDTTTEDLEAVLAENGPEAVREWIHGLRTIRYGSIALTLNDGRLVEINKTVKIRPRLLNQKE